MVGPPRRRCMLRAAAPRTHLPGVKRADVVCEYAPRWLRATPSPRDLLGMLHRAAHAKRTHLRLRGAWPPPPPRCPPPSRLLHQQPSHHWVGVGLGLRLGLGLGSGSGLGLGIGLGLGLGLWLRVALGLGLGLGSELGLGLGLGLGLPGQRGEGVVSLHGFRG